MYYIFLTETWGPGLPQRFLLLECVCAASRRVLPYHKMNPLYCEEFDRSDQSVNNQTEAKHCRGLEPYLFVEFIDDPFSPLQVQLLTLQRSVDISELDAHLANQQSVIFVCPVDPRHSFVTHLGTRA